MQRQVPYIWVHVRRSTHSYSNALKINVLYINCSIDQQIIVEVLRIKNITFAPWINSSVIQLFVEVLMSFPYLCSTDQQIRLKLSNDHNCNFVLRRSTNFFWSTCHFQKQLLRRSTRLMLKLTAFFHEFASQINKVVFDFNNTC